jgi:hypothetical protein
MHGFLMPPTRMLNTLLVAGDRGNGRLTLSLVRAWLGISKSHKSSLLERLW